jgi:predicted Zn-dependent protease
VTTTRTPPRIPRTAAALRLPLWQRGQSRMRERYGFDLNAPDARERVRKLLADKPGDADMHLLQASVLATQGNNQDAERDVRRAIELNPESARAHTTLATLLVQKGEFDQGLQEARRAAELDPDDPTVQYNLGLAEWTSGVRGSANAAFRKTWDLLYGERRGGNRPPWWRRIFARGTMPAKPDAQAPTPPPPPVLPP